MPARPHRAAAAAGADHAPDAQAAADPGDCGARSPHQAAVGLTKAAAPDLPPRRGVVAYHDATKHHFNRFARSLGYLDWATQPDPFRLFPGAPRRELPRAPLAPHVPYAALFDGSAAPVPITEHAVAEFLRCSMGLSAWKQYGSSRWALRVNPSSGNLHPTETYVIGGAEVRRGEVCHYDVRAHALEQRCSFDAAGLPALSAQDGFLVALTSIHWREAWKYGERAFRYCQHDAGHAIGALRLAAAMLGWRLAVMPRWSHEQMAALLGVDRDADFADAEREEPECVMVVTPGDVDAWLTWDPAPLVAAAREGQWSGRANRLSADRVSWPIIDEVAQATRVGPGLTHVGPERTQVGPERTRVGPERTRVEPASARSVILQRRSAVSFDGRSSISREAFLSILGRLDASAAPFDALWWKAQVHLAVFVHRVTDLAPGVYAYLRDDVLDEWRAAMRPDFLWEPLAPSHPRTPAPAQGLYLLVPIDARHAGNRVSCDQDIAGDGFFSLGMIARFEPALAARGDSFYRQLFWEAGLIGQVLYLEAEAAGARATGIGCYYDEPVHELLGLSGHAWQSLYHFCMGMPVEDTRLTTEPGYAWERGER